MGQFDKLEWLQRAILLPDSTNDIPCVDTRLTLINSGDRRDELSVAINPEVSCPIRNRIAPKASELVVEGANHRAVLPSLNRLKNQRLIAPSQIPSVSKIHQLLDIDLSERRTAICGSIKQLISNGCGSEWHNNPQSWMRRESEKIRDIPNRECILLIRKRARKKSKTNMRGLPQLWLMSFPCARNEFRPLTARDHHNTARQCSRDLHS
jgi:hypothetical protein